jgi:hypothetical protein
MYESMAEVLSFSLQFNRDMPIPVAVTETPKGALCSKLGTYRKMNE